MNYEFRCCNDHTCCFSVASLIRHVVSVLLHWSVMLFQCCFTDHTCCFNVASPITHVIGLMFINQIKCMLFPTSKLSRDPIIYVCLCKFKKMQKKTLANYLCLCRRSCVQNLRWFRGGHKILNLNEHLKSIPLWCELHSLLNYYKC